MRPSATFNFLVFAVNAKFPILIKGKPGIGKSDIVTQVAEELKANLCIFHPVVSDPTDFKGMPFMKGDQADFLPFGELMRLINAKKLTICFLDDLGQAPASVQAACMQLILARRINGHKVSDHVVFIAATNRREDKAGVSGLLEPVKSRFASIIELEVNTEDWITWALGNEMPVELISFIQWRPELLDQFQPTRDMVNTPSPRTVANIGKLYNEGLPSKLEFEVFKGTAGEAFAVEFTAFLKIYRELPDVNQIILSPDTAIVSEEPAVLYALSGALGDKANETNIGAIIQYLGRIPPEISVATLKNVATKNPAVCRTKEFINWASKNANYLI